MAAGLPCVVTDWNGYRDTVTHGEHGFRIPTVAPASGEGLDLAYWYANNWLNYLNYVGAASQLVAIDFAESTAAISSLVNNADLRRKLGRQAQAHVRATFDWSQIVPQYQALWGELDARRRARPAEPPVRQNPFRPDPFTLFQAYPTRHLMANWRAELTADIGWEETKELLGQPLVNYSPFNRASLEETQGIFEWLREHPGAKVGDLVQAFPAGRRSAISRGLLWIARYGVVVLRPPG
jgi:hypothetical protein